MEDNLVDYDEIIENIKENFQNIMNEKYDFYCGYRVIVAKEMQFIKETQMEPGAIYIVVSFSPTAVTMGQSVLPLSITAISEHNKLDVCQKLFFEMAMKYNLKRIEFGKNVIQQIYQAPTVTSNFNTVYNGFRSTLYINATFVITNGVNYFDFYSILSEKHSAVVNNESNVSFEIDSDTFVSKVNNKTGTYIFTYESGEWKFNELKVILENYGITINSFPGADSKIVVDVDFSDIELIPCINTVLGTDCQLNSEVFYNSDDFTNSIGKYGTNTFNIVAYLLYNNTFTDDALSIYFKEKINLNFRVGIKFKGRKFLFVDNYKIAHIQISQAIGDIPTLSATLTN